MEDLYANGKRQRLSIKQKVNRIRNQISMMEQHILIEDSWSKIALWRKAIERRKMAIEFLESLHEKDNPTLKEVEDKFKIHLMWLK